MRILVLIAGAFAVCATPILADPVPAGSPYAECPGSDVVNAATQVSWTQKVDTALNKHEELRRVWNAPLPKGSSRILVYWEGGDLETTRQSVIAVRNRDGTWRTSQVGDSVIWIAGAKPTRSPLRERDLTADESRRLDQLLADPCLYAGPTLLVRPVVGVGMSTLEIETPAHRWRASWSGTLTPQERAILELIDIRG